MWSGTHVGHLSAFQDVHKENKMKMVSRRNIAGSSVPVHNKWREARRQVSVTLRRALENNNAAASNVGDSAAEKVVNNAAKAASTSANSKAKRGVVKSWWKQVDKHGRAFYASFSKGASNVKVPKMPGMEMKVNVDVLKPTLDGIKQSALDVWKKAPPPVQKAAPYIAAVTTTAFLVHAIEKRSRYLSEKKLLQRMESLELERTDLAERLNHFENLGDHGVAMSKAIAEATTAAAQAAVAAAQAAQACRVVR